MSWRLLLLVKLTVICGWARKNYRKGDRHVSLQDNKREGKQVSLGKWIIDCILSGHPYWPAYPFKRSITFSIYLFFYKTRILSFGKDFTEINCFLFFNLFYLIFHYITLLAFPCILFKSIWKKRLSFYFIASLQSFLVFLARIYLHDACITLFSITIQRIFIG